MAARSLFCPSSSPARICFFADAGARASPPKKFQGILHLKYRARATARALNMVSPVLSCPASLFQGCRAGAADF